jgi:hypothetical protein
MGRKLIPFSSKTAGHRRQVGCGKERGGVCSRRPRDPMPVPQQPVHRALDFGLPQGPRRQNATIQEGRPADSASFQSVPFKTQVQIWNSLWGMEGLAPEHRLSKAEKEAQTKGFDLWKLDRVHHAQDDVTFKVWDAAAKSFWNVDLESEHPCKRPACFINPHACGEEVAARMFLKCGPFAESGFKRIEPGPWLKNRDRVEAASRMVDQHRDNVRSVLLDIQIENTFQREAEKARRLHMGVVAGEGDGDGEGDGGVASGGDDDREDPSDTGNAVDQRFAFSPERRGRLVEVENFEQIRPYKRKRSVHPVKLRKTQKM